MSRDADATRLTDGLGERWALCETSFKFHASCRHTHPSADALLSLLKRERLDASRIARITAHVHQGAIDVLGPVIAPRSVHQSKFSMGTVLALVALRGSASLADFDEHFDSDAVVAFRGKVAMELDEEVDRAYPARWIGKVTVVTRDGRNLDARVDEPKGDPGNTLTHNEIDGKARRLIAYGGGVEPGEIDGVMERLWGIGEAEKVERLS